MLIDSWSVVEQFERRLAEYTGAPHAVAVDTCTAAIFLCLKFFETNKVVLPARTYLGVACSAHHAGCLVEFEDRKWEGFYNVSDYVVDSACCLHEDCFIPIREHTTDEMGAGCLSFQYRKHLKIGRGGMVITGNSHLAAWLRKARFCGRASVNSPPEFVGWHAYMEPERAARGLVLLDSLPDDNLDLHFDYPDLREYKVLQ